MGETKIGSKTCGGSVAGGDVSAFDNCYDISGQEGTTAIDASYLLSGELCYLLNGNPEESVVWTQTLGTDEYPIPFNTSKPVYLKGTINCQGEMEEGYEFCNEPGMSIYAEHECDENGICTVCGQADPEFLTPDENGFYHIAEAGQLLWFAGMAQGNGYLNAVLESDIELTGLDWKPIGNEGTPFCGTFDGQCHFIEGMAAEGENNVGFFGAVAGGATIKNLVIAASCSVTAQNNAGGLIGAVVNGGSMVTIENCGNEAAVISESGNAGGILGNNVNACAPILMNNCYNLGDVTASGQAAGIGGSLGRAIVNNSWNKAAIESGDESNTFGNAATLLAENCYNEKVDNIEGVEKLAEESFTNGELCFLLNGGQTTNVVWYQTLGEDDYPVLDPSHKIVYLEEGEYTNNPTLIQLPEGNVAAPVAYYDLNGVRTETLRPGLNIVRFADGTVRKVFLK